MACILFFVLNNSRLCSTEGKLKGAQCSETVKSRVPSIWFVWKIWDFLVAWGQKLDTRGHWALWLFTCWAEFCQFLECKEIATGHNNNKKKTGSHLFLVFRKVISLFRSFVISPCCHFAISCFKHALVMQWFPLPPGHRQLAVKQKQKNNNNRL